MGEHHNADDRNMVRLVHNATLDGRRNIDSVHSLPFILTQLLFIRNVVIEKAINHILVADNISGVVVKRLVQVVQANQIELVAHNLKRNKLHETVRSAIGHESPVTYEQIGLA